MAIPRLSVSEFNQLAADVIKQNFPPELELSGEVSQATLASSGHFYFSLKDSKANISCAMFRSQIPNSRLLPKTGDHVICSGSAGIYTRDGRFQFYARKITDAGEGDLWRKFEALKRELSTLGYFKEENKKPLPFLPKCIGVVTSLSGAAIRDIINVSTRRFPGIRIQIISARVQGEGAAEEIARGIEIFNALNQVDLLIVGRGGGSQEDLWAFNERVVADAIHASRIPIISAVGHETDFSIADFTADLRASTPSAAAELALPLRAELEKQIQNGQERLLRALKHIYRYQHDRYVKCRDGLQRAFLRCLELEEQHLDRLLSGAALSSPLHTIRLKSRELEKLQDGFASGIERYIEKHSLRLKTLEGKLTLLNPFGILERGYSVALDEQGEVVTTVAKLQTNSKLMIRFRDGSVKTQVTEISNAEQV